MEQTHFNRSYHILAKKFLQYFFPVLITTVALSLNDFAAERRAATRHYPHHRRERRKPRYGLRIYQIFQYGR